MTLDKTEIEAKSFEVVNLLKRQDDPESLSANMNWKDFEAFVQSAFAAFGYSTQRNVRLRRPRAEIDLVCSRNGLAFAVDCKHWKRTVGHSSMKGISERQLERARRLAQSQDIPRIIPLVVTLRDESLQILENGIPVVPVCRLSDFILNWDQANDQIAIVKTSEKQML